MTHKQNFKKNLLLTTAIAVPIALGAAGGISDARGAPTNLEATASATITGTTDTDVTGITVTGTGTYNDSSNVALNGYDLTVSVAAADGLVLGNVTTNQDDGQFIVSADNGALGVTVETIGDGSFNLSTSVSGGTGATANLSLTSTGAVDLKGGTLDVTSQTAHDSTFTAGGDLTTAGTININASAAGKSKLVFGDATQDNTLTSGDIILTETTANTAILEFNGTGTKTVTGAVKAAANNNGQISVLSTGTVEFKETVGELDKAINSLGFADAGTATFEKATHLNTVTSTSGTANYGILDLKADANVISGDIGATGANNGLVGVNVGGDTTVEGSVFSTTLDLTADKTLTFNGTNLQTVSGNVTTAANKEGTLVVNNSAGVTFEGTIGASNALKQITLTEGATFEDNVTATNLTIADNKKATFGGSAATTITAAIDGAAANQGEIEVALNAGEVTFAGAIGANNALKQITLAEDATFKGDVTVEAISVANGKTATISEDIALTLTTVDGSNAITGDGKIDVADGKTVTLRAPDLKNGETITLAADTNFADVKDESQFVTEDNLRTQITYTAADNTITATTQTADTLASSMGLDKADATQFIAFDTEVQQDHADDEIKEAREEDYAVHYNTAAKAGIAAQKKFVNKLFETSIDPVIRGVVQAGSFVRGASASKLASFTNESFGDSEIKVASLADNLSLFNSNGKAPKAFWAQIIRGMAEQDSVNGKDGYDADTFGYVGGVDAYRTKNALIGMSIGYVNTEADGKDNSSTSLTDVDTLQGTVYGQYNTKELYVSGQLSYASSDINSSRVANDNNTLYSDYSSKQSTFSIEAGMPIDLKKGNGYITPLAGLSYASVETDKYSESVSGNTELSTYALDVEADNFKEVLLTLGARYDNVSKVSSGGKVATNLGLKLDFAVGGDDYTVTKITAAGLGASQRSINGIERDSFRTRIGGGVDYYIGDMAVGIAYEGNISSDYAAHDFKAQAKFAF